MRTQTSRAFPLKVELVGGHKSLDQVRAALLAQLSDEGKLSLLNARLILRTGINLIQPKPNQVHDAAGVSKVLFALREMGFEL